MTGTRWIFISEDCKVFRVPQPKNLVYKPISELSDQEVLEVILFYETKDRKPSKLLTVQFNRLRLNSSGKYEMNDEDTRRSMHNFFEFGMATPEDIAKRDRPLALPIAPVVPLASEKEALYLYLKEKLPSLAEDAPIVVEKVIQFLKQTHQKHIKLIKQAKKLKEKRT
ncbi:hypothetical protein MOB25_00180 [Bacillus haynesii]|uniref:hypothetical protein n=1 Tax=Bacillus haynesii TaxID=1925021 RepID=UPI00227F78C4|nr:hypothetical protein [Bacillus haynesii]MCY7751759.1 hypothetical protein [Bacillus haynesii]